jgi:hypothetical protein
MTTPARIADSPRTPTRATPARTAGEPPRWTIRKLLRAPGTPDAPRALGDATGAADKELVKVAMVGSESDVRAFVESLNRGDGEDGQSCFVHTYERAGAGG